MQELKSFLIKEYYPAQIIEHNWTWYKKGNVARQKRTAHGHNICYMLKKI